MAKRETSLIELVLAVFVGGFCLITGAWVALFQSGTDEFGMSYSTGVGRAYLPAGIAAGVLGVAAFLLVRRIRGSGRK
jgi:hypothetical protein